MSIKVVQDKGQGQHQGHVTTRQNAVLPAVATL